jgi:hypothetical protein
MTWLLHPLRTFLAWRLTRHMRWAADVGLNAYAAAVISASLVCKRALTYSEESVIESMLISSVADHDGEGPGFTIDSETGFFNCYDPAVFYQAVVSGASRLGRIY